jgi:acyl dehydratase
MSTAESLRAPAVGDRPEPRQFGPLTRTDFVKYQGASGDFHPLHHDEVYAHKAGFPSVFSVGMLQAGFLATYATDWLGAEAIRRYAMRFEEQCWPDDVLTCEGVVTDVATDPDENGQRVTVELTCTRQTGGVAISATAVFVVEPATFG